MNANDLNVQMEALMDRLDRVSATAPREATAGLNAALADWQDFYWGYIEAWPVEQLSRWSQRVGELARELEQLERAVGTEPAPVVTAPAPGGTMTLDPLAIVGTWPTWMKVAAGGILSLALYKVARKVKLL